MCERISFFNGRDFHDLDDLKAQLARWSTNIDDERPQRRKQHRTPRELHAEEQPHLIAPPRHAYDTARVVYRVCDLEGFVAWDGNRYSLPAENVTELLRHPRFMMEPEPALRAPTFDRPASAIWRPGYRLMKVYRRSIKRVHDLDARMAVVLDVASSDGKGMAARRWMPQAISPITTALVYNSASCSRSQAIAPA